MDLLYRANRFGRQHHRFPTLTEADRIAAKGFLQLALSHVGQIHPRVINVDGHPAYPGVIDELKRSGQLIRKCRCRVSAYINKGIEQDHRFVKKRMVASQWFRSVDGALNTIAGYEAMNMIRKGRCWLPKTDSVGPDALHRAAVRDRCLRPNNIRPSSRILSVICNTSPFVVNARLKPLENDASSQDQHGDGCA